MRAPPFARMAAVAAPRPDAEPVTIAHNPSPDIAFPSCDFGHASSADLPYRARKCLQIGKTPLRGIRAAAFARGARRTSALVMATAFPHHAAQVKPHPKRAAPACE